MTSRSRPQFVTSPATGYSVAAAPPRVGREIGAGRIPMRYMFRPITATVQLVLLLSLVVTFASETIVRAAPSTRPAAPPAREAPDEQWLRMQRQMRDQWKSSYRNMREQATFAPGT